MGPSVPGGAWLLSRRQRLGVLLTPLTLTFATHLCAAGALLTPDSDFRADWPSYTRCSQLGTHRVLSDDAQSGPARRSRPWHAVPPQHARFRLSTRLRGAEALSLVRTDRTDCALPSCLRATWSVRIQGEQLMTGTVFQLVGTRADGMGWFDHAPRAPRRRRVLPPTNLIERRRFCGGGATGGRVPVRAHERERERACVRA